MFAHIFKAMDHVCGKLEGFDFRLKEVSSLQRKILTDAKKDQTSLEQAAAGIGDGARYTMTYEPGDYVQGVTDLLTKLEAQGHKVHKFKNTWGNDPLGNTNVYQGLNINIKAPNGQVWELQIHTPESFHTKEHLNHKMYEEFRSIDPAPTKERQDELYANMSANQAQVRRPPGVEKLKWEKK